MTESLSIPAMHREHLVKALNTSCCVHRAAEQLGVTPRTVFRWKRRYGIVQNPRTRKWTSTGKALPVLSLLVFFMSCGPSRQSNGKHWPPKDVFHCVTARPEYKCRVAYSDTSYSKPLNEIK